MVWVSRCSSNWRRPLLAGLVVLPLCVGACPATPSGPRARDVSRSRAPDHDPLALIPDGPDLVLALDLRRLRRWMGRRPWAKGLLTAGRRAATARKSLDVGLLPRVHHLFAALWFEASAGRARLLLLARGRGLAAQARSTLGRRSWRAYRGVPELTREGVSTALLTRRTVISGPLPLVRQSIDLLRRLPGRASAREDRWLQTLWRRVAGPGAGKRPWIVAVCRLPGFMQQRARKLMGVKADLRQAALRFTGGSWVSLRALGRVGSRRQASALVTALARRVRGLAKSRLAATLRLAPLLAPLQAHHEGRTLYAQYQLPAKRFDRLARRLLPIFRILGWLKPEKGP